ncbi:dienelactone hydrolase [Coprinopsis cinerea AmutBmut pab1-1]|nr:dienelactone hydrolase [Coprinopsis cinerea AmutBmut pab1-1]
MLKLIPTYALLALSLLPSLAVTLPAVDDHASHGSTASDGSTWLATSIGPDCITGARYHGTMQGKNITIADVPTYYAEPPADVAEKKVIFFFSDVYGPFLDNNFMLQDWFASRGFHVLGIDYFFGDPIQNHPEPGFNITAWLAKSQRQAAEAVPKWKAAVIEQFGEDAKYAAVGYCFGIRTLTNHFLALGQGPTSPNKPKK